MNDGAWPRRAKLNAFLQHPGSLATARLCMALSAAAANGGADKVAGLADHALRLAGSAGTNAVSQRPWRQAPTAAAAAYRRSCRLPPQLPPTAAAAAYCRDPLHRRSPPPGPRRGRTPAAGQPPPTPATRQPDLLELPAPTPIPAALQAALAPALAILRALPEEVDGQERGRRATCAAALQG
jgi:hypothetical protein